MARYDEFGRELPDPRPLAVPAFARPLSLQDEIRRFVRAELSNVASRQALETFEEADDFEDEEDDILDGSQYEVKEMVDAIPLPDADPPRSKRPSIPDDKPVPEGHNRGSQGETVGSAAERGNTPSAKP